MQLWPGLVLSMLLFGCHRTDGGIADGPVADARLPDAPLPDAPLPDAPRMADAEAAADCGVLAPDAARTFACGHGECGIRAVCVNWIEGPGDAICGQPNDAGVCSTNPGAGSCFTCGDRCRMDLHICWPYQRRSCYASCAEVLAEGILSPTDCGSRGEPTCVQGPEGGFFVSCGPDRPATCSGAQR